MIKAEMKKIVLIIVVTVVVFLVGGVLGAYVITRLGVTCSGDAVFVEDVPSNLVDKEKAECIARGGEWRISGLALGGRCFVKTKDFGKECLDGKECEGSCLLLRPEGAKRGDKAVGSCSEYDFTLGCRTSVENGVVMPTFCAD